MLLTEVQQSVECVHSTNFWVPGAEKVKVEDIITGTLGLDTIENFAGFFIEALSDDILEEEWLCNLDGILDESLRVLLIEIGIKDSKIRHILLLGI